MRPLLRRLFPALCSAAARALLAGRAVRMALRPAAVAARAGEDAPSAAPEHGKSHEADLVKEALRRETQALLLRLNQIKELLKSPEIRTKISKELFEDRHNSSSKSKSYIDSESPNALL